MLRQVMTRQPATPNQHMSGTQLSILEQRQIVYSALIKYSAEAETLRERVFDQFVLSALVGSSKSPIDLHKIQSILRASRRGPALRDTTIKDTLERLVRAGKVAASAHKKNPLFSLTDEGNMGVSQVVQSVDDLFRAAFAEVLSGTEHHFNYEAGAMLCRKIVLDCFARYGRELAVRVTSFTGTEVVLDRERIEDIACATLKGSSLNTEARESVCNRLFHFFKSRTPAAEALKYHLSQGYYCAELLLLSATKFNPLAEQALAGTVFLLDANVLILAILDIGSDSFGEAAKLVKKMGVQFAVTEQTLRELKTAATGHVDQMKRFVGVVPDVFTEHTEDDFVRAFVGMRKNDPAFTLDQFLSLFLQIESTIRDRWQIEVMNFDDHEFTKEPDYAEFQEALNAEADAGHSQRKSKTVLHHDVSHCLFVRGLRAKYRKVWFLTRDTVLSRASKRWTRNEMPLCFSFVGFLHSVSPFVVTTEDEERPFADLLSDILAMQIRPDGPMFKPDELTIIAEMHSDVFTTPDDQLLMAFDYAKAAVLKGEPYNIVDYGKMSLGIKKFLSQSKEEQIRMHEAERLRLQSAKEAAERRATEIESQRKAERANLERKYEVAEIEGGRYRDAYNTLSQTTVSRDVAIRGPLAAVAILLGVVGILGRDWLLYAWGLRWQHAALAFDAVCLAVSLWGITMLIPLICRTPDTERKAFGASVGLAVIVFFAFGDHDVSRMKNGIDFVIKLMEGGAFWYLSKHDPAAEKSKKG